MQVKKEPNSSPPPFIFSAPTHCTLWIYCRQSWGGQELRNYIAIHDIWGLNLFLRCRCEMNGYANLISRKIFRPKDQFLPDSSWIVNRLQQQQEASAQLGKLLLSSSSILTRSNDAWSDSAQRPVALSRTSQLGCTYQIIIRIFIPFIDSKIIHFDTKNMPTSTYAVFWIL